MIHEKPPLDGVLLEHFGVKGMHWGVRKDNPVSAPSDFQNKGVHVNRDGSIKLDKGASIQRLVSSKSGRSRELKDITYASINEYDNAQYIKYIGGRSTFLSSRDQILSIKVTQNIKAPSLDEAVRTHSKLMLNDPEFREKTHDIIGSKVRNKELEEIRRDPGGKTARIWYTNSNTGLVNDERHDKGASYVRETMQKTFESKGYNALRDENDTSFDLAKTPIVIFNPEKSLKVTTVTQITKEVQKANKQKLKMYKQSGKEWIESQIYEG